MLRIDPSALDQLLHPTLDPAADRNVIAKGLPASPGAACGKAVFDADTAERRAGAGETVILVRIETSPDDIHGMHAAAGILTARGGMTSHAAVVARGMGRPCVSGAGSLAIDYKTKKMRVGSHEIAEGDVVTIDGSSGEVMLGEVPTVQPELVGDFGTLMAWADTKRRLKVRANAETPLDCRAAREFGAEGIGLCRTEHMFFDSTRIMNVRRMILASDEAGRRAALADLLPAQRGDFAEIFRIMAGLPVTIRLLDPPLHEFLPHGEDEIAEVADAAGVSVDALKRRIGELHEFNPMLGHRGCRLGITYPEIYEMQARAIFEAAADVAGEGEAPIPEVMVPLVATGKELRIIRALIERTAETVFAERKVKLNYSIGTMIELPRAALAAGEIAGAAEFFSFGTNDLTQTALGVSRDDAARFLGVYVEQGIYARDPFVSLDVEGVGELISHRRGAGQGGPPGPQARHLRRAWRRSRQHRFLRKPRRSITSAPRPTGSPSPASRRRRRRSGAPRASSTALPRRGGRPRPAAPPPGGAPPRCDPLQRGSAHCRSHRRFDRGESSVAERVELPLRGEVRRYARHCAGFVAGGGAPQRFRFAGIAAQLLVLCLDLLTAGDLLAVAALPFGAGQHGHAEDQPQHEGQQQDQPLFGREGQHRSLPNPFGGSIARGARWFRRRISCRRAARR